MCEAKVKVEIELDKTHYKNVVDDKKDNIYYILDKNLLEIFRGSCPWSCLQVISTYSTIEAVLAEVYVSSNYLVASENDTTVISSLVCHLKFSLFFLDQI